MCGIAGYLGRTIPGLLPRMIGAVRHRGPDGEGECVAAPLHLGHTRLAIIDLEGGAQPMRSAGGRFVTAYNGEIYNYVELRADLEARGGRFATRSDTEVIPLGFELDGPDFFARLVGMFAFVLADMERRRLYLVRDHFGIKPFYYSRTSDGLVFSSSARAVAMHPAVDRSLNPEAIRDYLQFRYVPSGRHFFAGVETLPPATILECDFDGRTATTQFWTPRRRRPGQRVDVESWVDETARLVEDAVRIQLRADVPVGIFLSGGADSSAVATFAARHATAPMTAYTYAMEGTHDEVTAAAVIADSAGARHVVVAPQAGEGLSGLYEAMACMDHPVGDAIVVPTYRLCRAAARDLKVVLTGEGADEVFGGYVHFAALLKLARLKRLVPGARHLSGGVRALPVALLNRFFDYQASLGRLGRQKLARMVARIDDPRALYRLASSVIDDQDIEAAAHLGPPSKEGPIELSLPDLMLDTVKTWLPYQILNKMDQLAMIHGLETRVPFLDPRLYDHLVAAPDSLFIDGRENKVLLRRVLERAGGVNARRPKYAFHVPLEEQFRAETESLCDEWLGHEATARYGILNEQFIRANVAALRQGEFLASKRLLAMVGLHMWLDAHA
jgi:asparagine synthase (glutamine-hydrolysing)